MRGVFLTMGAVVLAAYAVALATRDRPSGDRLVLRWATDPNPARTIQTKMFGDKNPGLAVEVEAGQMEKLIVQCATGTGPDLIDVYGTDQMDNLVKAGILMDLTPYAKEMGFDPSRTYPALRNDLCVEGRQYRFPRNLAANSVIYNKSVFDDHGIPYPQEGWTYDDFIEVCRKLQQPGKSGKTHIPVANWLPLFMYYDLLMGHGGRLYSADGLHSELGSDAAIQAMQFYHDLIHVHHAIPTPEAAAGLSSQGGWGTGPMTWFSTQRAAMLITGRWYLNILVNYPGVAEQLGTVRLPCVKGRSSSGFVYCAGPGVNVRSPHRMEALKFLAYLASSEYGRLIVEDGDSLPPNPDLSRSGQMLVNKVMPRPEFHEPFARAVGTSQTLDTSPFINASQVTGWLQERIGRVENAPGIDVRAMMRDLAGEIDRRMLQNIERSRTFQHKYREVTGRDWRPEPQ